MTNHTRSKPAFQWLLDPDSACAVTTYRQQLADQGLAKAGAPIGLRQLDVEALERLIL